VIVSEERVFLLQVIEIGRFMGLNNFVGKRDNLVYNPLFNFEPMEKFENWSVLRKLSSFGHNSTSRI